MLSQPQYYHAIKGQSQTEQTGTTFTGPVKSTPFKPVEVQFWLECSAPLND